MHGFLFPGKCRDFFLMIDSCEKEVELYTKEGFHLNLKSKLCQYVAFTSIFRSKKVKECSLITHCEADTTKILQFFLSHH